MEVRRVTGAVHRRRAPALQRATSIFGSVGLGITVGTAVALSDERIEAGVCEFSVTATAHNRHAIIKCYRESSPGNYLIRSTAVEADDLEGFRSRAQFAGRRLNCELVRRGRSADGDINYTIRNCRP